jgi:DNA helicase-2/ATP-dependent DNA helicase PcrA
MTLDEIIARTYPEGKKPNPDQLKAIKHISGPLLIVAGPGSGKTKTLITRTLNLLLRQNVKPENILLCTFTEKAARQLRDRLNAGLKRCGADHIDIHEMTIGTIHSVCQGIIDEYPNEAGVGIWSKTKGLGRGYVVLDDLKRMFFLMDHFEEIFGDSLIGDRYFGLWKGFWDTVENSQEYFDKITEEMVDVDSLCRAKDKQVKAIGKAMKIYRRLQVHEGKIDFAHLEWLALDLLSRHKGARKEFRSKFEHVMVDEYQDTNYIQEQLIFTLANEQKNIAVVGDVDQSIYRFRGATTQNILEFPERVGKPKLKPINLGANYRSSQQIIDLYQAYRDETDWEGRRYSLNVFADKEMEEKRSKYQATIQIDENNAEEEARKVVDLILSLKKANVIKDYNQVAILLHSVRQNHSGHYIEAIRSLKEQGEAIEVYAPRARLFFERPEVMCALAGLHHLNPVPLSVTTGGYPGQETESINDYLQRCVHECRRRKQQPGYREFLARVKGLRKEIEKLKGSGGKPKKTFLEYFYGVINAPFMNKWLEEELPARHLAQITLLIETFSEYYGYEWIGGKNADKVWNKFFNSFLRVLYDGGLNEYEEEEQAFPSGAVQIMTLHQSKGLEFPVVIVGSLHAQITTGKKVDDILGDYFQRELHEPRSRISEFDRRRLYYVGFSRARDFLVLSGHNDLGPRVIQRKVHFMDTLALCAPWDKVKKLGQYKRISCDAGDPEILKPVLGFTSHISAYERCPLQFMLQKLYGFVPKRNEQFWMGNVVHNTLKDIHDHILKRKEGKLTDPIVKDYLEQNIDSLRRRGIPSPPSPPGKTPPEKLALDSILRYVRENRKKLNHCRWAEKEILIDEKDYTLTGVIDLLIHDDTGHVELVDFKAGRKKSNEPYREGYADQVRLYCKQVEPKIGKTPDEAYLYWVLEPAGSKPIDHVNNDPKLLQSTRERVDSIARKIIVKHFPRKAKKDDDVCGICEFEERCWS